MQQGSREVHHLTGVPFQRAVWVRHSPRNILKTFDVMFITVTLLKPSQAARRSRLSLETHAKKSPMLGMLHMKYG